MALSALTMTTVDATAAPSAARSGSDGAGTTSHGARTTGSPATGAATTKAPTVATVTKQLAALGDRNEQLTESYNGAVIDLSAKQAQAVLAQRRAAQSATAYAGARNDMKLSLQAQYQEGTLRETTALLTSQSGQDYVDQSSALQQISDRRAGMAQQMATARTAASTASQAATQLVAAATLKRDALARQRTALAAAQEKYHALLDKLTAQQRLAFLAASTVTVSEKRIQAIETAPAGSAPTGSAPTGSGPTASAPTGSAATGSAAAGSAPAGSAPAGSAPTGSAAPVTVNQKNPNQNQNQPADKQSQSQSQSQSQVSGSKSGSSAAQVAVRFALAQRGKPYVYATSGPNSYDCSGLTAAAWQAAGVSIPHQSGQQYSIGHHVERSQLQPGDLVFFYSPIHHVALYIGNGLVVHAPTEGDVVKVAALNRIGPYSGATRI